LKKLLKTLMRF